MPKRPRSTFALAGFLFVLSTLVVGLNRYGVLTAFSEEIAFYQGLWNRSIESVYYQALIVGWLACLLYGSAVYAMFSLWVRGSRSGPVSLALALMTGLSQVPARGQAEQSLIFRAALSPLREATVLFPALGFIGTVVGVSLAIGGLNDVIETGETQALLDGLRVAFDTTLLGLVASVTLTLVLYFCDTRMMVLAFKLSPPSAIGSA